MLIALELQLMSVTNQNVIMSGNEDYREREKGNNSLGPHIPQLVRPLQGLLGKESFKQNIVWADYESHTHDNVLLYRLCILY